MSIPSSSLRVLTISASYHGDGGVAAHVRTLVQALYKQDTSIRVYVLTHDEDPNRVDIPGKAEKGNPYILHACFKVISWNEFTH